MLGIVLIRTFCIKHIHLFMFLKAQFTSCLLVWQSHFHLTPAGGQGWQWLVGSVRHAGTDVSVKGHWAYARHYSTNLSVKVFI